MSKSLGNFFTVRDILKQFDPEIVRFFILRAHYRSPLNYSDRSLLDAKQALTRLYTALRDLPAVADYSPSVATAAFHEAMDDDFNTPEAIAVLQGIARELNGARSRGDEATAANAAAELRALAGVLGVLRVDPAVWFRAGGAVGGLSDADIDALIATREAARQSKNWRESDRIRDELAAAGVILEDKPGGLTRWRRG